MLATFCIAFLILAIHVYLYTRLLSTLKGCSQDSVYIGFEENLNLPALYVPCLIVGKDNIEGHIGIVKM